MSSLVIKDWRAETKPVDSDGNFVFIVGRNGGLLAWLLSLIGVDPTTRLLVGMDRVEFTTSSLSGTETHLIPLECICSSYYGYHKPWKAVAWIVLTSIFLGAYIGAQSVQSGFSESAFTSFAICTAIGIILALCYYFLNSTLTLGFIEHSGLVNGIRFKRSIIENKNINEKQGQSVCVIVQRLIEAKHKRTLQGIRP